MARWGVGQVAGKGPRREISAVLLAIALAAGSSSVLRRLGEVSRTLTFYAVASAYPGVIETYPGGFAGSLRRVLAMLSHDF